MKRSVRGVLLLAVAAILLGWWIGPRAAPSGAGEGSRAGSRPPAGPAAAVRVDDPRPQGEIALAGAAIAGRVRDPQGRPIAGARVCARASGAGLTTAELWIPRCAEAGRDGAYRLAGLIAARHTIEAQAPGFIPGLHGAERGAAARLVAARPGVEARDVDLVLWPGGAPLRGVVRDVGGGEIEGAIVRAAGGGTAISGPDGGFELTVRPGEVGLTAQAEGYAPGRGGARAPGQAAELFLWPEAAIVGQVVSAEDGLPIAGAEVSVRELALQVARTDEDGQFRLGQLEPGVYKLRAEHDAYVGLADAAVQVGLGETSAPVIVRAHRATVVRGRIVAPDGGTCERGQLELREAATRRSGRGQFEAGGEVVVRGLMPGSYAPDVRCEGYVSEDRYEPIEVGAAPVEGVVWRVRAGRAIRGAVVDGRGRPGASVRVLARPDGADPRAAAPQAWSTTGPDGLFALVGLRPGRHTIEVTEETGARPARPVSVEVPAERDVEDLRIALAEGGEVRGRVVDAAGSPVARAGVALTGAELAIRSATTDDDGRFVLEGVAPGRYRASASRRGVALRRPEQGPDDVDGVPVEVRLAATAEVELRVEAQDGRISGQVVDGTGGPIVDASITWAREADGPAAAGRRLLLARGDWPLLSDGDGRFEIAGLAPGRYAIQAERGGAGGAGLTEHVEVGAAVTIAVAEVGEIGGAVRLAGGGAPELLRVSAREAGLRGFRSDEFFRTGGRFVLTGMSPGTYTVRAEAAEGAAEVEVALAAGEAQRSVELVLQPRVTVRGRVVDLETGAPLPGLTVEFGLGGFAGRAAERGNVTDAQGRFELRDVPTGAVRVSVRPANYDLDSAYGWASLVQMVEGTGTVELPPVELVRRRVAGADRGGDLGFAVEQPAPGEDPRARRIAVAAVRAGGPAAQAGLRVGDEIVAVGGHDVTGLHSHRYFVLAEVPTGGTVVLALARGEAVAVTAAPSR